MKLLYVAVPVALAYLGAEVDRSFNRPHDMPNQAPYVAPIGLGGGTSTATGQAVITTNMITGDWYDLPIREVVKRVLGTDKVPASSAAKFRLFLDSKDTKSSSLS